MSLINAGSQSIETYQGRGLGTATTLALSALILGSELVAPHLKSIGKDTKILGDSGRTYAFGGLTHKNASFLAPYIEPQLGPVDYIHYSSRDGVKPISIAHALSDRFNMVEHNSVQIVGQSLGLVAAMLSLQQCVEQGVRVPHIDTIWGLGSPKDHQDIKHWESYQHLPGITTLVGGFLTQYAGGVITDVVPASNKMKTLRKTVVTNFKNRHSTQTPAQWGNQLGIAYHESKSLNMGILADAGVIDADTQVRLGYDRYDPVVKAEQAAERWSATFEPTHAKVAIAMSESRQHIDLDALPNDFWRPGLAFNQKELYFNTQVA